MKIKSGFMLREIAGQWVVVPLGSRVVEFNSIMTLSESGAFIWRLLEKGAAEDEIVSALLTEYDAEETLIRKDAAAFIENLVSKGLCE
jgi:hypothetical protein